jgi:hypothetical protein
MLEEWLGDNGLGWLTLLPLPLLVALVVLVGGPVVVLGFGLAAVMTVVSVGCFGSLLLVVALDVGLGTNVDATVSGHTWERTVAVEEKREVQGEDWCDDLPPDARVHSRKRKFHHRDRRVGPDIDVYEKWCTYTAMAWEEVDTKVAKGKGLRPGPKWPKIGSGRCDRKGCKRAGDKEETYAIQFQSKRGGPWSCDLKDQAAWSGWSEGEGLRVLIGGVLGEPHCDTLKHR